ncbi:N-acetylglucosamine-6-phosphate deacetylase [Streptomyces sp. NBC_01497]|uniref:N-acetylglucosamine-6-phosphate deacetylase n=1 Tax=Streptomyces sp. NBC_01497 TaxID=2903885 RepID=UPI002E3479F8|nr:N-acetylglucosamine-6-phosphate deacetylase [Streptomyces sp. NBC_01497]
MRRAGTDAITGPAVPPSGAGGETGGGRLFVGGRFATADAGVTEGWLLVRGGRIHSLGTGAPPRVPDPVVELAGRLVVPGFVDPHCHGGAGHSLYTGDPDDVRAAAAGHLARGTTTMLASIATIDPPAMEAAARAVASVIDDGSAPNLVGIHFEGPFLSQARRGAQTRRALREPDPELMERLLRAAGGHAVSMTLAPELPGAAEFIRRHGEELVCCLGHTDADAEGFARAAELGARAVTHLFNAMPPLHHREPGPVAAALLDPRLVCEVILDGHHLADDTVRLAHRVAGPDRLMLVSDAMPAAGMADGTYAFADREVSVEGGVARLRGTGTLAGSTLFVAQALRRAVSVVGLPLGDAVRMASGTAARLLGLRDRGELRPGLRADLVALDGELRPEGVWLGGNAVPVAAL